MNQLANPAPELVVADWLNTPSPITLTQLRGKVVVIEAFQMLCPGCVSHGLPQAVRIQQTFAEQDVAVLGLHSVFEHHAAQGTRTALAAFLHEYQIVFPVAIDAPAADGQLPQTMLNYALRGTPSQILIDREGGYRQQFFGSTPDMTVAAAITELVVDRSNAVNQPLAEQSTVSSGGCDRHGCTVPL